MSEISLLARRIDDEKQPVLESRRHQIIEDAALLVQQQRITHAQQIQRAEIPRYECFKRFDRVPSGDPQLPHMRDVKEPCLRACVKVLVEDAGGIVHRHLVSCEGHHLGAKGEMERVERCSLERRRVGCKDHRTSDRADAEASDHCPLCRGP